MPLVLQLYLKATLTQILSYEHCEIFKDFLTRLLLNLGLSTWHLLFVGNKTKRYVCVSGSKKCLFLKEIWRVLFF